MPLLLAELTDPKLTPSPRFWAPFPVLIKLMRGFGSHQDWPVPDIPNAGSQHMEAPPKHGKSRVGKDPQDQGPNSSEQGNNPTLSLKHARSSGILGNLHQGRSFDNAQLGLTTQNPAGNWEFLIGITRNNTKPRWKLGISHWNH